MFNNMKKYGSVAVSAAMLTLLLTACGSNGNNDNGASKSASAAPAEASTSPSASDPSTAPVTFKVLTHYSTDDEKDPADWAAAELKKTYPNVTIEFEAQLNDNGDSLKTRMATGDLPDFFNLSPNQFDAAIQSGSILELTDAFTNSDVIKDMNQNSVDGQLKYTDGKIWAIPINGPGIDPLYYNKRVFQENGVKVPTNYPELLEAVKAFRSKGIVTIPIFAKEAWPIGAFFDMFAMRANPKGMKALNDGDVKASDPAMADAIGKMAELIKAGIFQKGATSSDYDSARSMFHQGKAAMLINGEWDIGDMQKDMGSDFANVDFLDIYPTTDAGKEDTNIYAMPGASELGGIAVNSKVKDSDFAMNIAFKLTQLMAQGNYVKEGRIDSTFNVNGLTSEVPLTDMNKKLLEKVPQYLINGTVEHSLSNKAFATGFGELLQKLVAGQSTEDFIKEVDALQAQTVKK